MCHAQQYRAKAQRSPFGKGIAANVGLHESGRPRQQLANIFKARELEEKICNFVLIWSYLYTHTHTQVQLPYMAYLLYLILRLPPTHCIHPDM